MAFEFSYCKFEDYHVPAGEYGATLTDDMWGFSLMQCVHVAFQTSSRRISIPRSFEIWRCEIWDGRHSGASSLHLHVAWCSTEFYKSKVSIGISSSPLPWLVWSPPSRTPDLNLSVSLFSTVWMNQPLLPVNNCLVTHVTMFLSHFSFLSPRNCLCVTSAWL